MAKECMSHGQSQEVKAAMLLHKAMEYETTCPRRSSPSPQEEGRGAPSTPAGFRLWRSLMDYASTRNSLPQQQQQGTFELNPPSRKFTKTSKPKWKKLQKLIDFLATSKKKP